MSLMSTCLFASFSRDIETGSTTVCGCVDGYEGTISALALTSFGSDEHSTRCLAEKRKSTTTAVSCAHSLHLHLPLKEGNAHTSCPWVSRQGCAIFCWDIGPEKGHQSTLSLRRECHLLHLTVKGCYNSGFFLPLIFCFKQCHNWRMYRTLWFLWALQSRTVVLYVQYLPDAVTLLTALGLCFCLLVSWHRGTHPDFPVYS